MRKSPRKNLSGRANDCHRDAFPWAVAATKAAPHSRQLERGAAAVNEL